MGLKNTIFINLVALTVLSGCSGVMNHQYEGIKETTNDKINQINVNENIDSVKSELKFKETFKNIINETKNIDSSLNINLIMKNDSGVVLSLEYKDVIALDENNPDSLIDIRGLLEKDTLNLLCKSNSFKNILKEEKSISVVINDANSEPYMIEKIESCK